MRLLNGKRLDWTYQFIVAAAVTVAAEMSLTVVVSALATATVATAARDF